MPAEIRHIVFRPIEVITAVREYLRRMRRPLPAGYLKRFAIETVPGEGVRAVFEVTPDQGAEPETATVGGAELAAALILFCASSKIPLPASGTKVLEKFGDHVTLIVSLNPKVIDMPLPEML